MNQLRIGIVWAVLAALGGPAFAQETPRPQQQQPQQQQQNQQQAQQQGQKATLDEIEASPAQYVGKAVTVEGRVTRVLGPRLFTVNEGRLIDFHPDTVVVTPAPIAALVDEGQRITLSGTVQPLVQTTIQEEWGWLSNDPKLVAEIKKRNGIVAQQITEMKDGGRVALTLDLSAPATGAQQTDAGAVARAKPEMIGQRVDIQNARVEAVDPEGGFWVGADGDRFYVLPESRKAAKVNVGQTVRVQGVVLRLPKGMKERLGENATNKETYVYAREIRPVS